uniref:Hemerythrin n=1 Tax=Sternaspis scutata TaxID=36133 RepID=A0A1S6QD46_9ANNE|nr:hemerythrin [Sternaspis scutata]
MGFEIPEPFKWDDSFCVFYATLDEQHKQLFQCLADCGTSPGDDKCLQKLLETVVNHFAEEEKMFSTFKYADEASHKAVHAAFVSDASGLKCPIGSDKIAWAKDWLVTHIKGTDFKYMGKLG